MIQTPTWMSALCQRGKDGRPADKDKILEVVKEKLDWLSDHDEVTKEELDEAKKAIEDIRYQISRTSAAWMK